MLYYGTTVLFEIIIIKLLTGDKKIEIFMMLMQLIWNYWFINNDERANYWQYKINLSCEISPFLYSFTLNV